MKKLCLGTFLRVLHKALISNSKQIPFTISLFSYFTKDDRINEENFILHLKTGKYNSPNMDCLKVMDKSIIVSVFKENIIPEIKQELQKNIILAFKDILKEDDVNDLAIIGYEEGYDKHNILKCEYFSFPDLLANLFYYCVVIVANTPYKEEIKEIDKNYSLEQFNDRINEIQLNVPVKKVVPELSLTVKKKSFEETFREIEKSTLSLPNSNEIHSFMLDVDANLFDYKKIKDFIAFNIGRYVYSRVELNQYTVNENIEAVKYDAIRAYKKSTSNGASTNHFNELMLYSFLECILGAPKIYSKMELQNMSSKYESLSAGIHLLFMKQGITPFYQLVFGASDSEKSLTDAINNAFYQIQIIKDNKDTEYNLIESTIMNIVPDKEMGNALEEIMIPKKNTGVRKPSTAFGIFLGYTIHVENASDLSDDEYYKELQEQMKRDIEASIPYIEKTIETLNVKNHTFYIYVLPLNDVEIDTEKIMNEALEVPNV